MALTVYTSVRDVDVRTCAPQPLLRSNYFAEFRTEADKAKARRNLGINEENDLFWGNIQGFIELQKDLIDYLLKNLMDYAKDNVPYTTSTQEDINTVKQALDFIFETIVDYGKHKEDYVNLNIFVEELTKNHNSLQEHVIQIEESFTDAINKKGEAIDNLINDLNIFKQEISEFQESISTNVENLMTSVLDINNRLSDIENTFDGSLKYNTTLNPSITAPNKIGGIAAGTTVESLKNKSLIDIIDILVFPTTVPTLLYPRLSYTPSNTIIKVGHKMSLSLNFYSGDSGGEESRQEVITLNGITINDFVGYNELGIYKHTATVNYNEGNYLINDRGNLTDLKIESGQVSASSIVVTTYPWFINNEELKLIPFNELSGEIKFEIGGKPSIKLPGNNSIISSFKVNAGSGFLDVNQDAWEKNYTEINGYPYQVWTKKTETDVLPYIINFKLSE